MAILYCLALFVASYSPIGLLATLANYQSRCGPSPPPPLAAASSGTNVHPNRREGGSSIVQLKAGGP